MEEAGNSICTRYVLVDFIQQRVEELQEEVSRLCCNKEGEQETGRLFETLQLKILGAVTSKDYQTKVQQ